MVVSSPGFLFSLIIKEKLYYHAINGGNKEKLCGYSLRKLGARSAKSVSDVTSIRVKIDVGSNIHTAYLKETTFNNHGQTAYLVIPEKWVGTCSLSLIHVHVTLKTRLSLFLNCNTNYTSLTFRLAV